MQYCIIRGGSIQVNYINQTIRAGRYSEIAMLPIHVRQCYLFERMHHFLVPGAEEMLEGETVLALDIYREGPQLDPIAALDQADEIFEDFGALPPPVNTIFRLVWFLGGDMWYCNQLYIRYAYPPPAAVEEFVVWDRALLLDDLELSEGRFLETEPSIIRLWDR